MTDDLSPETPQRLLTDLCRLAVERASSEKSLEASLASDKQRFGKEFQEAQEALEKRYSEQKADAERQYKTRLAETAARYESERAALEKEYAEAKASAIARFEADEKAAQQALQDAHWQAMESSDAARGNLNVPLDELLAGLDARWQELANIHRQAVALMVQRGHWDEFPPAPPTEILLEKHPGRRFCHAVDQAKARYLELSSQKLPRLFQGIRPWLIVFVIFALISTFLIPIFGWRHWAWAAISAMATALVCSITGALLSFGALRRSTKAYLALRHVLLQSGLGNPEVLEAAKAECRHLDSSILALHRERIQQAEQTRAAAAAYNERQRREALQRADEIYPRRLQELSDWHDRTMAEIEETYPARLEKIERDYQTETERLAERHAKSVEQSRRHYERDWAEMARRWQSGIESFEASAEALERFCRQSFPDWNTDDWSRWRMANSVPPVVPLGEMRINLGALEDGVPEDNRLRPARIEYPLPMTLPYPRQSLLLLKAPGAARMKAIDAMQAAMLRLLTAMPPGKVRFTIIDPVGLGDSFSVFMHLADYDEQLVASRIWTDAGHIEQRLADLTKHMEDVIQVYLRKEFHSIDDYNAFAGEMAEPYRVLVVADFPAGFTDASAERLKSIVSSGARCGVFTLMSVDEKLPFPRNFHLSDLEGEAVVLPWMEPDLDPDAMLTSETEGAFVWRHPTFGPLVVNIPPPPPPEKFKEIMHAVGAGAKDSGRVEVSFSCVVPEADQWWTADSRKGLDVPLGRIGAMKLQHLDLGSGTSQHVLIAGKTGSGKSTLLHVLITTLAMRYSPDEVELYLVDFKKGVEFKTYARNMLPHARVIAVESEREFGLSVLQRLDAELRTRGDLFRGRGMQDLKSYRTAEPDARLPRILLIIDEFQELFVEDDRIAQESALLLDRLVRQGRAFGIHVLLGSQTLGGAYTLARSTIGQMAVRIALQCGESDAHLILSEDNTAARLLTRPGEAIYNDANGLYEGNHPFQVVWLPDDERDEYLGRIQRFAAQRGCVLPPPIVFEGNILSDLGENSQLRGLLASATWPETAPAATAWLGSAVAIKEPTSVTFLRQNGANLLVVGHREEAAMGVLAACVFAFAAQNRPSVARPPSAVVAQPPSAGEDGQDGRERPTSFSGARFYILDGSRSDAPEVGFWNRLASALPHPVKLAGVRDAPEAIAEIAEALALRQQEDRDDWPPIYLFVYNLGRFRDLRKDDDFGFSSGDDGQPPNPARQFAAILREGAPLGIHVLAWCDTYANLTRMLDRQSLRDFEMRVLFQMNANDSSNLMDSPEAGRLGVHRAFFYDEGQGRMEKFRPYAAPSPAWLAWAKERLHRS